MASFAIAHRSEGRGRDHATRPLSMAPHTGVVTAGVPLHRWSLGFGQSSSRHITRVSRGNALNAFGSSPTLRACSCPLRVSRPGKLVDPGVISSELLLSGR